MTKIHILALGLMLSPFVAEAAMAQAQDSTMNQTMRLERDFSPIVQQKNKIDRMPAVQPIQTKKSDASFAKWQVESVKSSEIGIVPAGQVIATPEDQYDGYLELSGGNYWNTDLKAGYRYDDFRVDAKGFFTAGALKLPYDVLTTEGPMQKRWDSQLLSGDLVGTYSKTLNNKAQFEAHLGTQGTIVNTFNYRFLNDTIIDTLQISSSKPNRQQWGQIRADASYETDQFKLFLGYDFTKLHAADSLPGAWTSNTLQLRGSYGWYDNDDWQFSMDLGIGGVFCKEKSYFTIQPQLHYSYMPAPGEWRRVYADLSFGSRHEALSEVMERMPLAFFEKEYGNSAEIFNLHLGYEDNEQGYLRWGAELELGYTEDELCAEAAPIDTTSRDGLYMRILQDDCFSYGIEAHVDYEYTRYFGAKANIHYHGHSCEAAGMSEPHLQMALHLLSHPGRVNLDLGLDLSVKRELTYLGESYDLGTLPDLNFRMDWKVNDELNIFAYGKNLLGIQYELWPGIPAQRTNVHVGFNWVF